MHEQEGGGFPSSRALIREVCLGSARISISKLKMVSRGGWFYTLECKRSVEKNLDPQNLLVAVLPGVRRLPVDVSLDGHTLEPSG